jgi:hypothetical protein
MLNADEILVAFRDAMINRPGGNWSNALASWTCPTEPGNSISGECDPCGAEVWGNWEHIACRGKQLTFTKWTVRKCIFCYGMECRVDYVSFSEGRGGVGLRSPVSSITLTGLQISLCSWGGQSN